MHAEDLDPTAWKRAVAEIRAAATAAGRARLGACSLEGTRLFERALRAGVQLERAVTTEAFLADPRPRVRALFDELRRTGCRLLPIPNEVMDQLTDGRSIGALVGLAPLPQPSPLSELLSRPGPAPFFLGTSSVDSPGNIGALARTAHASGAAALLTAGGTDPYHPMSLRTSMGSLLRLPVHTRATPAELLDELRAHGVRTVGAVATEGVPLAEYDFGSTPVAIFVGSEAFGLAPDELRALDGQVTIPMADHVDSFSVNAAAAVMLWELRRARC